MEMPRVVTTLRDSKNDVTYHVQAYRTLDKTELLQAVGMYLRQKKGKTPKRGSVITIVSIIGFDG